MANVILVFSLTLVISSAIDALTFSELIRDALVANDFFDKGLLITEIVCSCGAFLFGLMWALSAKYEQKISIAAARMALLIFFLLAMFAAFLAFVYIQASSSDSEARYFVGLHFAWITILYAFQRKWNEVKVFGGMGDNLVFRLLDAAIMLSPLFGICLFVAWVHYERMRYEANDDSLFHILDTIALGVLAIGLPFFVTILSMLHRYYHQSLLRAFFPRDEKGQLQDTRFGHVSAGW